MFEAFKLNCDSVFRESDARVAIFSDMARARKAFNRVVPFMEYRDMRKVFSIGYSSLPYCYLMENCKLNATSQRWVSELSNYNFVVKYRPGIINHDADCLSRLPLDFQRYKDLCSEVVQQNAFEAIVAGIKVQSKTWNHESLMQ